jgi:tetratricopeptide (TPR) repeat protein
MSDRGGVETPRTIVIQGEKRPNRRAAIAGVALLAVVAAIAIAQAIGSGDDGDSSGPGGAEPAASSQDQQKPDDNSGSGDSGSGGSGSGSSGSGETVAASADGRALNDQGYALLQSGDVAGALPILEQAVNAFDEDSTDIYYAYALFNYADALMQAGRHEEAIPYLEKRLEWDDQTETVQAKLDEARAAAGEESAPPEEGKPPKPKKTPPGQAKKDG